MTPKSRTRVPDACSLAPSAFDERLAWVRSELPPPARVSEIPGGVRLAFRADPGLREKLAHWTALEDACCDPSRLRFALRDDAPAGWLWLELQGVGASAVEELWGRTGTR